MKKRVHRDFMITRLRVDRKGMKRPTSERSGRNIDEV
jgi:hypothetical protein